jgi:hypothetical protein
MTLIAKLHPYPEGQNFNKFKLALGQELLQFKNKLVVNDIMTKNNTPPFSSSFSGAHENAGLKQNSLETNSYEYYLAFFTYLQ